MPPAPHEIIAEATEKADQVPLWMVLILAMASGLSGEMLRASTLTGLGWKQIAGLIIMRFSAGMLVGVAAFMAAYAWGVHPYTAAAACICVALVGGDVASTLIQRYAARKIDQA